MRRCRLCALVLLLDLFEDELFVCNLCLDTPRSRAVSEPQRGEWREPNTVSKVNDLFMRRAKVSK